MSVCVTERAQASYTWRADLRRACPSAHTERRLTPHLCILSSPAHQLQQRELPPHPVPAGRSLRGEALSPAQCAHKAKRRQERLGERPWRTAGVFAAHSQVRSVEELQVVHHKFGCPDVSSRQTPTWAAPLVPPHSLMQPLLFATGPHTSARFRQTRMAGWQTSSRSFRSRKRIRPAHSGRCGTMPTPDVSATAWLVFPLFKTRSSHCHFIQQISSRPVAFSSDTSARASRQRASPSRAEGRA